MASDKKKGTKGSKKADKALEKAQATFKETATDLLNEVEATGGALVSQVKELFDSLADKVAGVATNAVETTATVAEKVAAKEVAGRVGSLLDDVKEAGEASLQAIGEGFDSLHRRVTTKVEASGKGRKAGKATSKKNVPDEAKATAKAGEQIAAAGGAAPKKATTAKAPSTKATAKKAAAKKTPARKATAKKATTRKAPAAKKATSKKVAPKKKTAGSTAAAGKETSAKKPAATKKTTTKKPTARQASRKKSPAKKTTAREGNAE